MDCAAWLAADDPVVGVVDSESDATDPRPDRYLADAIDAAFAGRSRTVSIATGPLEDVLAAEPSVLVTVGEAGLMTAARAGTDVPFIPIGPVSGVDTIDAENLETVLTAVLDGHAIDQQHPLLGVSLESESGPEERGRALFDVTLVTDEPARISEYGVESRGEKIVQFRADGVVVATPAGSYGYACAIDAPHLSSAIDAVAVAPIAPFVTTTRRWVLPHDDLGLSVERDEGDVCLLADDRRVGTVSAGDRVSVGVAGTFSTIHVPDSRR